LYNLPLVKYGLMPSSIHNNDIIGLFVYCWCGQRMIILSVSEANISSAPEGESSDPSALPQDDSTKVPNDSY